MSEHNHVVMFSGGAGSWAAAKRVAEKHGTERLTLLFADTLIEDPDLYRFIAEAAKNVGGGFVRIADGRSPWDLFRQKRFLGNSKMAPCSYELKGVVADRWLADNCDPAATTVYVGIDWSEQHRFHGHDKRVGLKAKRAAQGWNYEAPLIDAPYLTKIDLIDWLRREGIAPPRLYALGFAHNNCGGGCVKAGIGHFAHLLRAMPEVYAEWERNENELRATLGDVSILTDRRGGERKPLPLTQLRSRIDARETVDLFDIGGCGCFVDESAESPATQNAPTPDSVVQPSLFSLSATAVE